MIAFRLSTYGRLMLTILAGGDGNQDEPRARSMTSSGDSGALGW
jgi:hypothetical protein